MVVWREQSNVVRVWGESGVVWCGESNVCGESGVVVWWVAVLSRRAM